MYGYNKKDINYTAYLKIRLDDKIGKHGIYKLTKD